MTGLAGAGGGGGGDFGATCAGAGFLVSGLETEGGGGGEEACSGALSCTVDSSNSTSTILTGVPSASFSFGDSSCSSGCGGRDTSVKGIG